MDKHPQIIFHDEYNNAGFPLTLLQDEFITPTDRFFMRNHGPFPQVDPAAYRLQITGLVDHPLELSLEQVKALPRHELTATLQCAGNRRQELMAHAPIDDQLGWDAEAIGNAHWVGAGLADVLTLAGIQPEARHAAFLGLDEVPASTPFYYGSSIPVEKACRPEVLLAYEMNGQALSQAHGFPLRVVVGGYIGARSVKWLSQIKLQTEPSDNYFQAVAYKLFPNYITPETVDYDTGLMLGELSVNSVILSPAPNAELAAGAQRITGYAMTGGERIITRVDVSADGGKSWQMARFIGPEKPYTWRLWEAWVNLARGEHELVVRACDSSANLQPAQIEEVWNFKGYMNNAWHRVAVKIT